VKNELFLRELGCIKMNGGVFRIYNNNPTLNIASLLNTFVLLGNEDFYIDSNIFDVKWEDLELPGKG